MMLVLRPDYDKRRVGVSKDSIVHIRATLDNELSRVEELIRTLKFQESAEYLSRAEEIFE